LSRNARAIKSIKEYLANFFAKKGKFGYVKRATAKNRRSKKMRGGADDAVTPANDPAVVPGADEKTSLSPANV
jgi:hypothetical protein